MVSVEKAKQIISEYAPLFAGEQVAVQDALKRILIQDVAAPIPLPPFRQSAMDGYALHLHSNHSYNCLAEVPAGSATSYELRPGEAVRIFTGSQVPQSANAVVMQEWVDSTSTHYPRKITVHAEKQIREGANIRPVGEQLNKGDIALLKGTALNAAGLGFLQSFGLQQIPVVAKPVIKLVITGNELAKAGNQAEAAQIYESNSITLSAALRSAGYEVQEILFAEDDLQLTTQTIQQASIDADIVLVSGGISVGDHDHVLAAFQQNQVKQRLYKIKQKPGKPMYFGQRDTCSFFGLPGNPASALTCLYHYVIPHLNIRSGLIKPWPKTVRLPLAETFHMKGDRAVYLKANIVDNQIVLLGRQASSMLSSFAIADGLVYLGADTTLVEAHSLVELHLL